MEAMVVCAAMGCTADGQANSDEDYNENTDSTHKSDGDESGGTTHTGHDALACFWRAKGDLTLRIFGRRAHSLISETSPIDVTSVHSTVVTITADNGGVDTTRTG